MRTMRWCVSGGVESTTIRGRWWNNGPRGIKCSRRDDGEIVLTEWSIKSNLAVRVGAESPQVGTPDSERHSAEGVKLMTHYCSQSEEGRLFPCRHDGQHRQMGRNGGPLKTEARIPWRDLNLDDGDDVMGLWKFGHSLCGHICRNVSSFWKLWLNMFLYHARYGTSAVLFALLHYFKISE